MFLVRQKTLVNVPLHQPAAVKKAADSSDSDEPEDKDDKPRSKKNKVGYNTLVIWSGY